MDINAISKRQGRRSPSVASEDAAALRNPGVAITPGALRRTGGNCNIALALLAVACLGLAYKLATMGKEIAGAPSYYQLPSAESPPLRNPDETDGRLSPASMRGKRFLARALADLAKKSKSEHEQQRPSSEAEEALFAIANALSGGKESSISGLELALQNAKALDGNTHVNPSRNLVITGFAREGASYLMVEGKDKDTGEDVLLRFRILRGVGPESEEEEEHGSGAASKMKAFLAAEDEALLQVLGGTPAPLGAVAKGVDVPSCTGEIAELGEGVWGNGVFVSPSAQLMETSRWSLGEVLEFVGELPSDAKTYIAASLVLKVLHLQSAEISHNDIRLGNCMMQTSGSFVLSSFDSCTRFNDPLRTLGAVTPAYLEPKLLLDIFRAVKTDDAAYSHPSADLWSCGVTLYELFTDKLPYDLEIVDSIQGLKQHAKMLLEDNPSSTLLASEMDAAGVPHRWQELLLGLLKVKREERITSKEIIERFPDLLGHSGPLLSSDDERSYRKRK